MGENTARDYSNQLEQSRIESPGNLRLPQNGKADNYNSPEYADNYNESSNHASRLEEARSKNPGGVSGDMDTAKDIAKTAKNVAGAAAGSPKAALSLAKDSLSIGKQIDLMKDMPFVAALGAAILKDLLDFFAGPTVILSILFSILCSIFIFMMLLLVSANSKRGMANSFMKKGMLLIGGGIADSLPGIDFFPIETATVAGIYYLTLLERKNAPKEGASDNYEQDEEESAE